MLFSGTVEDPRKCLRLGQVKICGLENFHIVINQSTGGREHISHGCCLQLNKITTYIYSLFSKNIVHFIYTTKKDMIK